MAVGDFCPCCVDGCCCYHPPRVLPPNLYAVLTYNVGGNSCGATISVTLGYDCDMTEYIGSRCGCGYIKDPLRWGSIQQRWKGSVSGLGGNGGIFCTAWVDVRCITLAGEIEISVIIQDDGLPEPTPFYHSPNYGVCDPFEWHYVSPDFLAACTGCYDPSHFTTPARYTAVVTD